MTQSEMLKGNCAGCHKLLSFYKLVNPDGTQTVKCDRCDHLNHMNWGPQEHSFVQYDVKG